MKVRPVFLRSEVPSQKKIVAQGVRSSVLRASPVTRRFSFGQVSALETCPAVSLLFRTSVRRFDSSKLLRSKHLAIVETFFAVHT